MRLPMTRMLAPIGLGLLIACGLTRVAGAQVSPGDAGGSYAGKQVRFFTMGSPGGGYDTYMRTLIPPLEKRLGAKLIPINESAAGGLVAMNRVVTAPPDGLTFVLIGGEALVSAPLYKLPGVNYDVRTLTWVARVSAEDKVVLTASGSPFTSIADMAGSERPVIWGGTGKSDGNTDFSAILAFATGMKAKIVLGYKGSPAINLSMESGETDARVVSDESAALFVRAGKLRVVGTLARQRSEQFSGVPTVFQQSRLTAQGERMLDWRAGVAALGRLIVSTPGVPSDRLSALRAAFKDVLADPEVIAEIRRRSLSPGYASGEQVADMVAKAMTSLDDAALSLVREVIGERYY